MNIEDLKKLSVQDALQEAAKFTGVDASVLEGIWNAESSKGKNMLSPAGARGHFGLMPKTQALFEKKLGVKIDPNDFHESLFVAANHLKEDLQREGGNVISALRAYNNGPNWRNQKDPRGENAAYASRVMGGAVTADAQEGAPSAQSMDGANPPSLSTPAPYIKEAVNAAAGNPKTSAMLASTAFVADIPTNPQTADIGRAFSKNSERDLSRQQEIDNTGFIDTARALFMHQGILGGTLKRVEREDYPPVPGYSVPEAELAGRTEDEQSFLREASSPKELERYKWELDTEREDMRKASLHGGWYTAAAGIFAGLPEGVVTGVGTAKLLATAGLGSIAAAEAGQLGKAIGYSVLENVGGNLAATALEDAISGRMSAFDYAVAGASGLFFTGLGAYGHISAAAKASQERLALKIAEEAAVKQREVAEKALAKLGPNATPEELRIEMDRIEAEEVKKHMGTNTVGEGRRIMPDMEKLQADEAQVEELRVQVNKDAGASVDEVPGIHARAGDIGRWDLAPEAALIAASKTPNQAAVLNRMLGKDWRLVEHDSVGVHYADNVADKHRSVVDWIHKNFLNDVKLYIGYGTQSSLTLGEAIRVPFNGHAIRIQPGVEVSTLVHELGHAILSRHFGEAPEKIKSAMKEFHHKWMQSYVTAGQAAETAEQRSLPHNAARAVNNRVNKNFNGSLLDAMAGAVNFDGTPKSPTISELNYGKTYWPNFHEMGAEQFTKWLEATLRSENKWKPAIVPPELTAWLQDMWTKFVSLFTKAKERGYLNADTSFKDFFEHVRKRNKAERTKEKRAKQGKDQYRDEQNAPLDSLPQGPELTAQVNQSLSPAQQQIAGKYGLDMLPVGTPLQRAEQKALVAIYERADTPSAPWNNIDPKWVDTLTAKFPALGSTGLLMLRSKNPVARMVAAELLESTTGAGGRRSTASLDKYIAERRYLGNTINEFQDAYKVWRNAQGGGIYDDFVKGEYWAQFNRKVAEEIEARRSNTNLQSPPAVVQAADVLEAAYERMRLDQIDKKTIGWGGLPATSKGYMPHRISAEKVRNMSQAEHRAFHSALVDQFVGVEGWDISFSANLASKYIDRAKVRAMGGHEIPANVHHVGAGDVVRSALEAMGLTATEIHDQMAKFMRGGAGHTKGRLNIDLLKKYDDNGREFTLMDLFETDQLQLVRGQAGRVSGETALAKYGVMGKPGMQLLRRAIADFGEDAAKAQPTEVQAFDQVAAEFLNQPFGDYGGKWMNRAMQANSLARLGGMGFTQFSEYINAATHLGVGRAMAAVSGLPRLRAEAVALAKGEKVDNPIIGSLEVYGGAEFGTDAYKMVFPFDNPSLQYQVNGHDTVTLADRLLRGGAHAQGKLSFWRAIHSAQQRGVAEQIVHKAVKFVRDGAESKALKDMGIDDALARQLQAELPNIARFDGNGNLVQFDITRAQNVEAAEQFVQAVHRGVGQIIQGTFIGETGKWAHSGWLRLLTQFRTFSLTSVEKQWARNRNNYGVAAALGMLMGSMAVAAPVYMARQYAASIGREDREAWLEKQLSPEKIARATLNYVASSGLAGDFLDAFASVSGVTEATGGRAGSTTEFVGTVIAPAAGLADDLWRGIQNSKDGTDVHELLKNMPFAKLPWLVPVINLTDD